jgi:hypothetical protein
MFGRARVGEIKHKKEKRQKNLEVCLRKRKANEDVGEGMADDFSLLVEESI